MLREIAVLRTLAGTPVPHPGFIAGCDDLDVLGRGVLPDGGGRRLQPRQRDGRGLRARRRACGIRSACPTRRSLARLGNVAWEGSPLAELKRPGSFLERQVPQFLRLLESYRHDELRRPNLSRSPSWREWLEANRPPDSEPGIMHGDAHLSNVLLRRDRPELAAFVDWEMCTVGDPLLDLGWMLICWPLDTRHHQRGRPNWPHSAGWPAGASCSMPTWPRVAAKRRRLDWYLAMACFKLGIVIEGTWSRYLAGQASREAGERLHSSAQNLIDLGTRVAKGDNPFELGNARADAKVESRCRGAFAPARTSRTRRPRA